MTDIQPDTGQMHPRDWAKNCLFYTQEIVLLAATPGQVAKEALVRNAKLLRSGCEAWVEYCGWKPHELMDQAWREHKGSASEAKAKEQVKGNGRKR